jgi:hypothetical protein
MTRLVLPKWSRYALIALGAAVLVSVIYLPHLGKRVKQLATDQEREEQARREITQAPILTATDAPLKTKLFFIAPAQTSVLTPVEIQLPLSADPLLRAKQLIAALIANAPSDAQRTLPANTELLAFYLLSDGTAIADFSDALSTSTPSGILSEQLVVDSLTQTLAAGVPQIHRLKILLHGQEADTLAGHLDLTIFFPVGTPPPAAPAGAPAAPQP